jgi:hypothetical protein
VKYNQETVKQLLIICFFWLGIKHDLVALYFRNGSFSIGSSLTPFYVYARYQHILLCLPYIPRICIRAFLQGRKSFILFSLWFGAALMIHTGMNYYFQDGMKTLLEQGFSQTGTCCIEWKGNNELVPRFNGQVSLVLTL